MAELHLYSKGDHGFGIKVREMPSDGWIQRACKKIHWILNEFVLK
jgi:hypothetical protein